MSWTDTITSQTIAMLETKIQANPALLSEAFTDIDGFIQAQTGLASPVPLKVYRVRAADGGMGVFLAPAAEAFEVSKGYTVALPPDFAALLGDDLNDDELELVSGGGSGGGAGSPIGLGKV
jgi:hypothetical protein